MQTGLSSVTLLTSRPFRSHQVEKVLLSSLLRELGDKYFYWWNIMARKYLKTWVKCDEFLWLLRYLIHWTRQNIHLNLTILRKILYDNILLDCFDLSFYCCGKMTINTPWTFAHIRYLIILSHCSPIHTGLVLQRDLMWFRSHHLICVFHVEHYKDK